MNRDRRYRPIFLAHNKCMLVKFCVVQRYRRSAVSILSLLMMFKTDASLVKADDNTLVRFALRGNRGQCSKSIARLY